MKELQSLELQVAVCPTCYFGIYSRAHHDYHHCPCGNISIDGGFDYCHIGWEPNISRPRLIILKIKGLTKRDLYDDWNYQTNKYGTLGEGEVRALYYSSTKKNIQMVRRVSRSKEKSRV